MDDLNLLSGATAMPGRGDMPAGHVSTGPPNVNGGNVDIKHITKGTTLFLPVFVEGAYFSVGTLVPASHSLRKSFDGVFCAAAGFEFEKNVSRFNQDRLGTAAIEKRLAWQCVCV